MKTIFLTLFLAVTCSLPGTALAQATSDTVVLDGKDISTSDDAAIVRIASNGFGTKFGPGSEPAEPFDSHVAFHYGGGVVILTLAGNIAVVSFDSMNFPVPLNPGTTDLVFPTDTTVNTINITKDGHVFLLSSTGPVTFNASASGTVNADWINSGTANISAGTSVSAFAQSSGGNATWDNSGTAMLSSSNSFVSAYASGSGSATWTNSGMAKLSAGASVNVFGSSSSGDASWTNSGIANMSAGTFVNADAQTSNGDSEWANNGALNLSSRTGSIGALARSFLNGNASWTNSGMANMSAETSLDAFAFTNNGNASWTNAGSLVVDANTFARIGAVATTGGTATTTNLGLIHAKNATPLALLDASNRLLNSGQVFFDAGASFGHLAGIFFVRNPNYDAILNERGLARDNVALDFILPTGPSPADLANRAVFELKQDGITNWEILGGVVYKEGPDANTPPPLHVEGSSPVMFDGKFYWVVQAGEGHGPSFDSKAALAALDAHTALFIPSGNSDLLLPDSGTVEASLYSVRGFINNTLGDLAPVDQSIVVTKEGAGTLTMLGDNTWYRGVFNIEGGVLVAGTPTALGGGDVNLVGGTLQTPSFDPLTIRIGGNFTQDQGGTLKLGMAGTNLSEFDRLEISGQASLNGTLSVFSLPNFRPQAGDAFQILRSGLALPPDAVSRSGKFATINDALNNNPNLGRVNVYAPNGVELVYIKGKGEIDDVEPDALPVPPIVLFNPTAEQLTALFEIPFSGANMQRFNLDDRMTQIQATPIQPADGRLRVPPTEAQTATKSRPLAKPGTTSTAVTSPGGRS